MKQSPFLELDYYGMVKQVIIVIPILDIESDPLYTKQDARRSLTMMSKGQLIEQDDREKILFDIEMSRLPERLTKKVSKKILRLSLLQLLKVRVDYEIEGDCWGEYVAYRGSFLN